MTTVMAHATEDRTQNAKRIKEKIDEIAQKENHLDEEKRLLALMVQNFTGESSASIIDIAKNLQISPGTSFSLPKTQCNGRVTKKVFVEQMVRNNHTASLKEVQDAWTASGRDGTISASSVYKIKSELTVAGEILPGRRGRKKGQTKKEIEAPQTNITDIDVRKLALDILKLPIHKNGRTAAEITEIIEINEKIPETSDLAKIVQDELKALRDEGKVVRGNNRQYFLVK